MCAHEAALSREQSLARPPGARVCPSGSRLWAAQDFRGSFQYSSIASPRKRAQSGPTRGTGFEATRPGADRFVTVPGLCEVSAPAKSGHAPLARRLWQKGETSPPPAAATLTDRTRPPRSCAQRSRALRSGSTVLRTAVEPATPDARFQRDRGPSSISHRSLPDRSLAHALRISGRLRRSARCRARPGSLNAEHSSEKQSDHRDRSDPFAVAASRPRPVRGGALIASTAPPPGPEQVVPRRRHGHVAVSGRADISDLTKSGHRALGQGTSPAARRRGERSPVVSSRSRSVA